MPSKEILIARHGETDWNLNFKWQGISDIPLNSRGLSQAKELGERLRNESIGKIYCSDLVRSKETAEIVSGILGTDTLKIDSRLRERSLGKFEGWKVEDVGKYAGIPPDKLILLETDEVFIDILPSVEPWDNFSFRVWNAFQDIASESDGGKILIVGHGGVMRALYRYMNSGDVGFPLFKNCEFIRAIMTRDGWNTGLE